VKPFEKSSAGSHTATLPLDIVILNTLTHNNQLSGAAEARRAHNPEDLGSKPSLATSFWGVFFLVSVQSEDDFQQSFELYVETLLAR
jgi:hypothetical protein